MKIITDNSCFYAYSKYLGKFITQFTLYNRYFCILLYLRYNKVSSIPLKNMYFTYISYYGFRKKQMLVTWSIGIYFF